jgi:hypothetical protein
MKGIVTMLRPLDGEEFTPGAGNEESGRQQTQARP